MYCTAQNDIFSTLLLHHYSRWFILFAILLSLTRASILILFHHCIIHADVTECALRCHNLGNYLSYLLQRNRIYPSVPIYLILPRPQGQIKCIAVNFTSCIPILITRITMQDLTYVTKLKHQEIKAEIKYNA